MTETETYVKHIAASIFDRAYEQFFVFTNFTASDDQEDIEKGILSVKLTDGHQFWRSKESITAEELSKIAGSGRMKPALEALTDKFPSTQTYTYSIGSRDEDLFLSIFFTLSTGVARSRLRIHLFPVEDAKAAVASTLETLVINLHHLKVATERLRRTKSVLEAEVAAISALKQDFAANKQEKDLAEIKNYEGISALLNIKKKQLRAAAGKDDGEAMEVEEEEGQAMDVEEGKGEVAVDEGSGEEEEIEISEISEEQESTAQQSPKREYDQDG
ncbi:hypothetical protein Ndes2526B_g02950 [Nannochloris sp. 'desiccata']|nr:hypothetical protein KSW81_006800 [Chlorella desiccata (nom. nud.)]KAH7622123.1 hypothetical protein NADE_004714 [Chlorella desiccata (nom. nud.)]